MISLLILTIGSVASPQSTTQDRRVELWGGLREGMTSPEVEAVLLARPDITSVKVAKDESVYGRDVEVKYRGRGIIVGGIPMRLEADMDSGRLHSVVLIPQLGGPPACASVGQQAFSALNMLLATKYAETTVNAVPPQTRARLTMRSFSQGLTYVLNRIYISRNRGSTYFEKMTAARCAADDGVTGSISIEYISRAAFEDEQRQKRDASAQSAADAARNL